MADIRYFAGDKQLTNIIYKNGKAFGRPKGVVPVFSPEHGWQGQHVEAERSVEYKSRPSRHKCDDRCLYATGRIMKCECSCGGKNHGRGHFQCDAA